MKIGHIVEYIVFQVVAGIVRILPFRFVQWQGGFLGEITYSVFGFRRGVTLDNLRHAFPEKSKEELDHIARGVFKNIGITLFELLYFPRLTLERIREVVHFKNPEMIQSLYKRGRGIIFLSAHFGSWELLAQGTPACLGLPSLNIAKPQSNPYVDRVVHQWRTSFGNTIIPMDLSIREILKTLGNGGAVGMIADQTAAKENIWIEFFGRKVPTHQGPAVFSLKTGAPLIMLFSVRQPNGSYMIYSEEVPASDLNGYTEENVVELTKRHVKITEKYIRQYPDHWMWTHKRWKHVPDSELDSVSTESV
ncbi:MAG: lysophospholipid acyltransferase family protein [Ignavibacteriales bacterium]|nr:lysophospholipid acyltransferase family protein [Ignavibacteriales bacterium]